MRRLLRYLFDALPEWTRRFIGGPRVTSFGSPRATPLFIDSSATANTMVLQWLRKRGPHERPFALPVDHPDPYYEATCHPNIVETMWDRLAAALPHDTRCLAYGTPCLVHPISGVLLAVGMGMQYCIRILPEDMAAAASAGCTPVHTWARSDDTTDLRRELGPDWVFGDLVLDSRDGDGIGWSLAAYRGFASPPSPDAILLTRQTPAEPRARRRRRRKPRRL